MENRLRRLEEAYGRLQEEHAEALRAIEGGRGAAAPVEMVTGGVVAWDVTFGIICAAGILGGGFVGMAAVHYYYNEWQEQRARQRKQRAKDAEERDRAWLRDRD